MNLFAQVARRMRGAAGNASERRTEPRLSRSLPVHILDCRLDSTNVTAAGLQVECPGDRMDGLRARWSMSATPVDIVLPDSETVHAQCAVAYVSTWDEGYLIGLKIVHMDEPHAERWQAYVARLEEQSR